MVRAKFQVIEVAQTVYGNGKSARIKMQPAYGDSNRAWSETTPQGSIEMYITNPSAVEQLKLGEYYYVDFKPAPAKEIE